MSHPDFTMQHIEKIKNSNNAISVLAGLLIKFQVDSDCGDEIPAEIKNGFVRSGLLEAILIAADASEWAAEWLEAENRRRSDAHIKQNSENRA